MSANEQVKERIKETLKSMGFDAEVFEREEEGHTVYNIKTFDAKILIGKQGANLEALQHIIRAMTRRFPELAEHRFALDVDDYKDKRTIYLKELARKAAHYVRDNNKAVMLEPMASHERRVIHHYLSLYNDIASQSTGMEPARRIIIRLRTGADNTGDEFKFLENA
jgi:spoIIIJ-associated protein